jgi:hypothetical protein
MKRTHYLTLLGINWAFDNDDIINFKKGGIYFEINYTWVVQPLNPYQRTRYKNPIKYAFHGSIVEKIYNLTIGM